MLLGVILLTEKPITLAQDLTLFEETESSNDNRDAGRGRAARRDSDGNIITGPEFTLIGTTRVGGNFLAVVEDRVGEIISISAPEGAETSIPGYPGFQVVVIGSGNVVIRYPNSISCTEFRNQGVSCDAPDIGRLVLANADPLESSASGMTLNNPSSSDVSLTDEEPSPNPFEALLERASNPASEVDTTAFTPRRINPEDVPQGMRVVSTPFGDRLVEEE
ncbi:MAG: hypothetical protein CBB92_03995 [Flammeovirgaceae bacterium TMED32]|nr:MAG: hypothetical protein CBB92_03995 [Flammeovirgaceae bacterium TMED32]